MTLAEQLVLQAEDGAALDGEVAAAEEAHRLPSSGAVERLGHGRSPVDDDRFRVLIGDRQPTDVEALRATRLLGPAVDPTEHQCGITEVEFVETLDERLVEGVALESSLHRAAEVGLVEVSQAPRRRLRRF